MSASGRNESRKEAQRLRTAFSKFAQKFNNHHDLLLDTSAIVETCLVVLKECHMFDVVPTVPINGFRAAVDKVRQLLEYSVAVINPTDVADLCEVIQEIKRIIPKVSEELTISLADRLVVSDKNALKYFQFVKSISNRKSFDVIFNSVSYSFDSSRLGTLLKATFHLLSVVFVMSKDWMSSIWSIISVTHRYELLKHFYLNLTYQDLLRVVKFSNQLGISGIPSHIAYGKKNCGRRIRVPRTGNWFLNFDQQSRTIDVVKAKRKSDCVDYIDCFVYQRVHNAEKIVNMPIVVHVHGGGFLLQDLSSYYIPPIAEKIPGLTIISIDISTGLSLQGRFPGPVNEVLDVLFWLQSKNDNIKGLLQLERVPEDYYLFGDSGGALIMMQVLAVINEINKKIRCDRLPECQVRLPRRLITCYPTLCTTVTLHPSFLLTTRDMALFTTSLAMLATSYFPNILVNGQEMDITTSYNGQIAYNHRPEEENVAILSNFYFLGKDPFFNPIMYDWTDFKDLPLDIFVGKDDPACDLGLAFIPYWKGQVHLEVMENVKHGFLYLLPLAHIFGFLQPVEHLLKAEQAIITRIASSLAVDSVRMNEGIDVNENKVQ